MNAVILGATRGMGRSLARLMAERKDHVFILGREGDEVDKSAADLAARGATEASFAYLDLENPDGFDAALDAAWESLGKVDRFVITAAMFGTQEKLEDDEAFTHRLLTVNYANTVLLCEKVRKRMLASGGGTLCVFSSVAGDRGRKTVGLYGSTKAGLSHYLESLDHKYREQGLVTVCVKPGFVKTSMTAGLDPPPFAGEPDQVAALVLRAIDRKKPLIYAPGIWRLVMLVIKHLPRFVMRRVGF